jgi:hypothetical protein
MKIVQKYNEFQTLSQFKFDTSNWTNVKDHVFLRLFNVENLPNGIQITDVPHMRFMDLVATFSIEEKTYINNQRSVNAYMLKNADVEKFSIDLSILKTVAVSNIKEKNGPRLETLIENSMKSNVFYPLSRLPEGLPYGIDMDQSKKKFSSFGEAPQMPMFMTNDTNNVLVISNRTNTFASTNLLFPDVLEKVYHNFGNENFYIIPMSVHKSLCVRKGYATHNGEYSDQEAVNELSDMLEHVNDIINTNTAEILSYNVYYHVHDDKCTMIVG